MTRTVAEFDAVLSGLSRGLSSSAIAAETRVPRRTVHDWLTGPIPEGMFRLPCGCMEHDFTALGPSYPYLLGIYLGDGYLATHPRGVFRLRVALDARYPEIVREVRHAVSAVVPGVATSLQQFDGHVEVRCYSRRWPCLLPQHGPGRKHQRRIALAQWQQQAVDHEPEAFLRGLVHSDGCRSINTGTNWRNPRYSFSNRSDDIRALFMRTCDRLGLRWTQAPYTVYVSRKADVARMDEFIGPKR